MNVLILGGTGFLSGAVARTALAAGAAVYTVTRGQRPAIDGATSLIADRKDSDALAGAVREPGVRFDLVIDCIGFSAADARQDLEVFADLADRLVFISTDLVYAADDRRPWRIDERFDRFSDSPYGQGKVEAERELIGAGVDRLAWTILRPCHIYGPGSLPGCLPYHGRDAELLERLHLGETLRLVGGGRLLQQPVAARDVGRMCLSVADCDRAVGAVFHAAGPDIIESRTYYQLIADELKLDARIDEASIAEFVAEHPAMAGFCVHRVYAMDAARAAGLAVPQTPVAQGLAEHVRSLQPG